MDKETAEQLRTTKALYDDGVLTEEEYNAKKAELLHAPAVVAQPPANEHGGVVQGHVVTEQPQKVHPEPRPQEDILAKRCECERRCECGIRPERPTKKDGKPDYGFRWDGEVQKWVSNHRSNEESARAATLIQAKARRSAALKDYQLPPGATSATSLQGWWLGLGIGVTGAAAGGKNGEGGCCVVVPLGGPWCFKLEAHGHNRLRMTNQCGCPISPETFCAHGKVYNRVLRDGAFGPKKNMFKQKDDKEGCEGCNTLDFHDSCCLCLTFGGCQGICLCCLPVMCRIPLPI